MLRGEIRVTDLDPARPSEAYQRRPTVIVSNDRANATAARLGRGVVTIVPITSTVTQVFPFQVLLPPRRRASGSSPRHEPNRSGPCPSNAWATCLVAFPRT